MLRTEAESEGPAAAPAGRYPGVLGGVEAVR